MKKKRKTVLLILAVLLCLAVIYICTVIGAASISFADANKILANKLFGVNIEGISQGSVAIIWNVRLPRVILGFIAGASLAVCGAGYQGIFKNQVNSYK